MKKELSFISLLTLLFLLQSCQKDLKQSSQHASAVAIDKQVAATDTTIADSTLLCYLPFNGGFKDKSGHNNNGTPKGTGSLVFVSDRFGNPAKALSFANSNAWVEIPEAQFVGLKTGTISMDFYATSSAHQALIGKMSYSAPIGSPDFYQSFLIIFDQPGPIQFAIRKKGYCNSLEGWNPTIYSGSGFLLNQWNHLAVTFDNTIQKMYLNGNLVATSTKTVSPICAGEPIRLGVWWQEDPNYFTGIMDEVRLYNRVLSKSEIKELSQK